MQQNGGTGGLHGADLNPMCHSLVRPFPSGAPELGARAGVSCPPSPLGLCWRLELDGFPAQWVARGYSSSYLRANSSSPAGWVEGGCAPPTPQACVTKFVCVLILVPLHKMETNVLSAAALPLLLTGGCQGGSALPLPSWRRSPSPMPRQGGRAQGLGCRAEGCAGRRQSCW